MRNNEPKIYVPEWIKMQNDMTESVNRKFAELFNKPETDVFKGGHNAD